MHSVRCYPHTAAREIQAGSGEKSAEGCGRTIHYDHHSIFLDATLVHAWSPSANPRGRREGQSGTTVKDRSRW